MLDLPPQTTIVVTASRAPQPETSTSASVTLIEAARIDGLGVPLVTDFLRLAPSIAVSVSGPAGSLTDVRIRGAEANHSLLFIDGIRANDPAAGNAPRFELLNADLASRIEIVRGPQSALWGSEAIGGVVAVTGAAPGTGQDIVALEAGSLGTRRGAARASLGSAERGISLGLAGQGSDGIDSFAGGGDRDGYRNLSGRAVASYRLAESLSLGGAGFVVRGTSEFDGYDPLTFQRADTADRTRNRLVAGRLHATVGARGRLYATASASLLRSRNANFTGDEAINRTRASRATFALEAGHRLGRHGFVAAVEGEAERFHARDLIYGGLSDQDRARRHQSLTVEWKMSDLGPLSTDVAIRRDKFSRFQDATTVRGSALIALGGGFSAAATYGEGIAQPTFFDLYGFFPGSFAGNPSLSPEKSRGGEASLRFRRGPVGAALTYYRQRLRNEIVDVFAFPLSTTVNATGTSRREGAEIEFDFQPSATMHLSAHYAYLEAAEPSASAPVREQRRPRHSGSVALDGARGRLAYGAAIAFTGAHVDTDFDRFPAERVRLDAYWLASARIGYRLRKATEVHLRIANAFDANYQDVLRYRTEGRSIHAGIRFGLAR